MLLHLGSNMWSRPGTPSYNETMLCDKKIWVDITSFLPKCGINTLLIDMGEGVFLKSHPEIAIEGTWSQEEFKEDLARIRELGLTPLPKFNFSCCHNGGMKDYVNMVGSPAYEQFCRDVVEETIELFGRISVYDLMDKLGYEQVPTVSSYMDRYNPEHTMNYCKNLFENPDNVRGYITAPWITTTPNSLLALQSDAWFFGCGKRKIYPECE